MAFMLDTSVAIHLRDGDPEVGLKVRALRDAILFSMITLVELEAGLRGPEAEARSSRLAIVMQSVHARPFDERDAAAYGRIVNVVGFSRRKVLDRMIAAQALVDGATLVTMNPADFREIPGLDLIEW